MSFRRFLLVRIGWALIALWLAVTLVFLLFFVGALDNPARAFAGGERALPAQVERGRTELHLDDPIHEQYAHLVWRLVSDQTTARSIVARLDSGDVAAGRSSSWRGCSRGISATPSAWRTS